MSQSTLPDTTMAKVTYILYLCSLVAGITAIIGVVIAYIKRSDKEAPTWLTAHYNYQIQTFWYGLAYFLVGLVLTPIIIGGFIILWWIVWLIVRSIKGLSALERQKAIEGTFFGFGNESA